MAKFRYNKKEIKFENKELEIAKKRERILVISTYATLIISLPALIIGVATPHKALENALYFLICVVLIACGSLYLYAAIKKWIIPETDEKVLGRMDKSKYRMQMNLETTVVLYILGILGVGFGIGFIIYYYVI